VGEDEIDARFKVMPDYPSLRHFKKGISSVKQWTETEHKEMQRIFIALIAGAVPRYILISGIFWVIDLLSFPVELSLSHERYLTFAIMHNCTHIRANPWMVPKMHSRYFTRTRMCWRSSKSAIISVFRSCINCVTTSTQSNCSGLLTDLIMNFPSASNCSIPKVVVNLHCLASNIIRELTM
jgi:hypothetical protein